MFDIPAIVERLVEARGAYYGTGHAIMTDEEYDSLEDFVRKQDPEHPFFETIGHPVSSAWKKADHKIFMGSLEKVNTEEEFMKWRSKFEKDTLFCMQFKLDGLSLSLDYGDSKFERGITRGNGTTGENISKNVVLMKGFRQKATPFTGSIRAEILLSKENFIKINTTLPEKDKYANPRNAAAGISRRLDGKFCKYLQIVAYDINEPLDEPDKIKKLKGLGYYTPVQYVGPYKGVIEAYENIKKTRKELPYDIDGIVVKAVSHETQEAMGIVNNKPKGQKAWKFDPPGAATIFIEEEWNVGRTGVVTPLAHLEPVDIEGSVIRRATLHNVARIRELNIGPGDIVMLVKRGDIIPYIESVLSPNYICPECGFKGSIEEQKKHHAEE